MSDINFTMDDKPSCSFDQKKDKNEPLSDKSKNAYNSKTLHEMGFRNTIPNWKELQKRHKRETDDHILNLLKNDAKGDIEIKIGESVFRCHKLVLKAYTNYFKEHPNLTCLNLTDGEITPGAFNVVYRWMIDTSTKIECDGVMEVIKVGTFFGIPSLLNLCWNIFSNQKYFCEDVAFMVYFEARPYDFPELKDVMIRRVHKFYTQLTSTLEFVLLSATELEYIISNDFIEVNTECEVFFSIVHWLNYDWNERQESVVMLMRCIRFTTMPVTFLLYLTQNADCEELTHVVEHPEVKKMIKDCLEFCIIKESCPVNELPAMLTKLNLPYKRRNWIFDQRCSYHHRSDCKTKDVITYDMFLTHIENLQEQSPNYWQSFIPANDPKAECCIKKQRDRNSGNKMIPCSSSSISTTSAIEQRSTSSKKCQHHRRVDDTGNLERSESSFKSSDGHSLK